MDRDFKKIKGVVKYKLGFDGVDLLDVEEPKPEKGELKVRVLAAGICGSDIHALHDQREVNMPVVLGHEFVGKVAEVNGGSGKFEVGDWITAIGSHRNGAMAEPMCCIVRGVYEQIDVKPGDVAYVSGPGPIGILMTQLLKSRGAYVVISGLPADMERLQLAKELGADVCCTVLA